MDKFFCFIKFTEKKFAEKLIKKGQIYFNLPSSFNNSDNKERVDKNEGAEWIDNSQIINIKVEHPTLGKFEFESIPNSVSKIVQYNYYFLSFSLYIITPALFNNDNTHKIDSRMIEFGDTAVIIEEPYIFLNTIIAELKRQNLDYEINTVNYRNLTNGKVELTPFDKKQEHKHHCEFRIIIKNTDNNPKTIEIGSIENYSRMTTSKSIIKSNWTAKRDFITEEKTKL